MDCVFFVVVVISIKYKLQNFTCQFMQVSDALAR